MFPIEQVLGVLIAIIVVVALFAIVFLSKKIGNGAEKLVQKIEKDVHDESDEERY